MPNNNYLTEDEFRIYVEKQDLDKRISKSIVSNYKNVGKATF